jgi:hypothetical protein
MIRNLLERVKNWWQEKVTIDKRRLFVLGTIVAAFFCITLGMEVCIVPTIFLGFIIMFFEWGTEKPEPDWWKMGAVVLGGLLIQIFKIITI